MGQEALLHCDVVANPNKDLSFLWYFNGETLDAGNAREIKVRVGWVWKYGNDDTFVWYW